MTSTNASLHLLLMAAYDIQIHQISGSIPNAFPAKASPEVIPDGPLSRESTKKLEVMLQALLADRFKLKLHIDKKELSVYALMQDRNGHKLRKASDRDCSVTSSPCRWSNSGPASGITGQSMSVSSLSEMLGFFNEKPIVDKTGITGLFDIRLSPWSRDAQTPGALVDGVPADIGLPSLSAVLAEVGLRLESQKALVDIYVIDHVEAPSTN